MHCGQSFSTVVLATVTYSTVVVSRLIMAFPWALFAHRTGQSSVVIFESRFIFIHIHCSGEHFSIGRAPDSHPLPLFVFLCRFY